MNGAVSGGELGIELQARDKTHLEKLNKELGGAHTIKDYHHEKYIAGHHTV